MTSDLTKQDHALAAPPTITLGSGEYLAQVIQYGFAQEILTIEDQRALQQQLWLLMEQQTKRYTWEESSSIPVETAEELLTSVQTTLGRALRKEDDLKAAAWRLKTTPLAKLLTEGQQELELAIAKGKRLLKQVQDSALPIKNLSYHDTLKELDSFFLRYDHRLFAHDIPCSLDYQLCRHIPGLQGIEYINAYLYNLLIENTFCRHFDKEHIEKLLTAYHPSYPVLLLNIFEPVFTSALGLTLLEKEISPLEIREEDRKKLEIHFRKLPMAEAEERLAAACQKLCRLLGIEDQAYLDSAAKELYTRIKSIPVTEGLEAVFLAFREADFPSDPPHYIDNDPMEDKALRHLIEKIRRCDDVEEKISLVKGKIHSLQDLVEVLGACFWEEESLALFRTLADTEIALLCDHIRDKRAFQPNWASDTRWEDRLLSYSKACRTTETEQDSF